MSSPARKRRWPKVLGGIFAALMLLLLGLYLVALRWAHQRPPVSAVVPQADRDRDNARFAAAGIKVPDGGLLLERPFDAPFTGRSLIVPRSWFTPPVKLLLASPKVRAKQVLGDVELLEQIMPRQYGGYDYIAKRGFDWNQLFSSWKQQLAARGDEELSVEDAFAPMAQLSKAQLDNHTQIPVMLGDMHSSSRSWSLAHEPKLPCAKVRNRAGEEHALPPGDLGEQPRRALAPNAARSALEPAFYLALPERLGELEDVSCGEEWISLAPLAPAQPSIPRLVLGELLTRPEVKRLDPATVWIRLPSMSPNIYADVETSKKSWPQPDGKEQVLLVDLRGNGGGADDFGWQVLQGFIDRKTVRTDDDMMHVKSCLYAPMRWNFYTTFGGIDPNLPADELAEYQQDADALVAPYPTDCPRVEEHTQGTLTYRDHHPQHVADGPLIIAWLDAGCGSDCEALAMQLASLKNTWVVGVNSSGTAQFIQPGYGVLPNTGLPFRFALGMSNLYGDDRSVDGHGLDVDVVLDARDDWTPEKVAALAKLMRVTP